MRFEALLGFPGTGIRRLCLARECRVIRAFAVGGAAVACEPGTELPLAFRIRSWTTDRC